MWLSRHRLYALPPYAECKAVLRDDKRFVSGKGVALFPPGHCEPSATTSTDWPPMSSPRHSNAERLMAFTIWPTRCPLAVAPDIVGWSRTNGTTCCPGRSDFRRAFDGRRRAQALLRRMRTADDRLHRAVAGYHHQLDLECPVPLRNPSRAVADPQGRPVADCQCSQRDGPRSTTSSVAMNACRSSSSPSIDK